MPPPQCAHLWSHVQEGVLVLTLTESQFQDEKTAEAILQEMQEMVTYYAARKVAIDFQNVKYISSVAFRPLLNLRRKLQELGGRLILCGLSHVVGDVFYTTRLVSATGEFAAPFEMRPDVASAIARLNSDSPYQ